MKRLIAPVLLAASAVGLCLAPAARAEVITLAPVADTFIRSDQPSASQADNPLLLVGDTGAPGAALRAVLGFDLGDSTLPAGAVVRAVSLRLVSSGLDADSFDAEDTLELHALPDSFATNATWTARAGRERWRTPGALGGATPLATTKANAGLLRPGQAVVFEDARLSEAVIARRAGRLDLLIKLADENLNRGVFRFGSSRAKGRAPSLVIEYDLANNPSGVVPLPGNPERPLSPRYRVTVGGRPVEIRDERYNFDVGMFDLAKPARVEIELLSDFTTATLQPERHGLRLEREGRKLRFTLGSPLKLVLKVDSLQPLALLATPPEMDVPARSAPDVLYFGPGVTTAGVIRPRSNQTIYLAAGALVKGRIEAQNVSNVSIRGRGILDTSGWSKREDKTLGVLFEHSRDIVMEGVGIRAFHTWWQTLFLNSRDIRLSHLNLFGVGVNTDGVDIDGVRDFLVHDTFIRAEDDGLGWHALDAVANGEPITERAVARDLVIWNTGAGNGIRLGASMETQLWRDILIENVDILMHDGAGIYSDYSDWAWTRDIVFRNITIERPNNPIVFKILKTHYSNATGFHDERGNIERLVFENVTMRGGRILLAGAGPEHRVDQVHFNQCVNAGVPVRSLADIVVNPHVTNVRFDMPLPPRPATPADRLEAEELETSTNARPQSTYRDSALSGGKGRLLRASALGDHIDFALEDIAAGTYRVRLGVKRTPASGMVRLSLDGVPLGNERDLHAPQTAAEVWDLGSFSLDARERHLLRLAVSDRHATSSGLEVHVDYVELIPER